MTFEKDNHEATTPVDAAKKTKTTKAPTEAVTLAQLCKELKADPTEARVKLRAAVAAKKIKHAAGESWTFPKGSPVLKTVRAILKDEGEKS